MKYVKYDFLFNATNDIGVIYSWLTKINSPFLDSQYSHVKLVHGHYQEIVEVREV
jgi:hypothetical protein